MNILDTRKRNKGGTAGPGLYTWDLGWPGDSGSGGARGAGRPQRSPILREDGNPCLSRVSISRWISGQRIPITNPPPPGRAALRGVRWVGVGERAKGWSVGTTVNWPSLPIQ
ncbi:hypothetical protein GQ53DRAFT_401614 [Thozetella sp. PMI_491]|nr:hypothetical protein GQ53DRAFT_401614 [Thozetella sp. PMI_491]